MEHLQTADLCAQLDTMKHLCDQLQALQADKDRSHALVERIQREADALRDTICGMHAKTAQDA
jgi:hypothetical protein